MPRRRPDKPPTYWSDREDRYEDYFDDDGNVRSDYVGFGGDFRRRAEEILTPDFESQGEDTQDADSPAPGGSPSALPPGASPPPSLGSRIRSGIGTVVAGVGAGIGAGLASGTEGAVHSATQDRVRSAADSLLGNPSASDLARRRGQAQREYLQSAFPELNPWEYASAQQAYGAGALSAEENRRTRREFFRHDSRERQRDRSKDLAVTKMQTDASRDVAITAAEPGHRQASVAELKVGSEIANFDARTSDTYRGQVERSLKDPKLAVFDYLTEFGVNDGLARKLIQGIDAPLLQSIAAGDLYTGAKHGAQIAAGVGAAAAPALLVAALFRRFGLSIPPAILSKFRSGGKDISKLVDEWIERHPKWTPK